MLLLSGDVPLLSSSTLRPARVHQRARRRDGAHGGCRPTLRLRPHRPLQGTGRADRRRAGRVAGRARDPGDQRRHVCIRPGTALSGRSGASRPERPGRVLPDRPRRDLSEAHLVVASETVTTPGNPRHQQPHGAGGSRGARETEEERRVDGRRRHPRRSGDDLRRHRRRGRCGHRHPAQRVSRGAHARRRGVRDPRRRPRRGLDDRRSRHDPELTVVTDVDGRIPGRALGPFAHLRPGPTVGEGRTSATSSSSRRRRSARASKANHLSYLGDATIGEGVNIGAGTITCNYDGVHKHPTVIEDGAFIGSDSQLVAPVTGRQGRLRRGGVVDHRGRAGRSARHRAGAPGEHGGLGGRKKARRRQQGSLSAILHPELTLAVPCSGARCQFRTGALGTRDPAQPNAGNLAPGTPDVRSHDVRHHWLHRYETGPSRAHRRAPAPRIPRVRLRGRRRGA